MLNAHDNTVNQNETFNITCRAQAKPAAKYRFYKNQVNVYNDTSDKDVGVFPTSVNERVLKMNYSCTPFNKFGDGPMDVIAVSVLCKYISIVVFTYFGTVQCTQTFA